MSIWYWILLVLGWAVCGVLSYGLHFAYYQRKWPRIAVEGYKRDRLDAAIIGLTGPIGLLVVLYTSRFGRYGLKWQ